ncbi:MAG: hypothetical protein PVI90_13170 [Desulfobacteraceae bacterium]
MSTSDLLDSRSHHFGLTAKQDGHIRVWLWIWDNINKGWIHPPTVRGITLTTFSSADKVRYAA